jgi:phosphoribosylamine--glycine ligase
LALQQAEMRGILVVGAGAREHAILWGMARNSPKVPLYAAPGNPGMAQLGECVPLIRPSDIVRWAADKGPLLVVIGPEGPLAEGLSDALRRAGHIVVGPSQEAAQLESSKAFAKRFMDRHHLPTASWEIFYDADALKSHLTQIAQWPVVLKQSRLAQGKGVVVAESLDMVEASLSEWSADPGIFRDGVIVESCLVGREVSLQVLTNGSECLWLPLAQDYKRLTADEGSPNTGGMGAYAPVSRLTPQE